MVFNGEFRKERRSEVDLLAGLETPHNIDFRYRTRIKNMHVKGMSIESSLSIRIGEKRVFRFFVGSGQNMRLMGRIIWAHKNKADHTYGVEFADMGVWQKFQLKRFLARRKKIELAMV